MIPDIDIFSSTHPDTLDTDRIRTLTVSKVTSNHVASIENGVSSSFDQDIKTGWTVKHHKQQPIATSIFQLRPNSSPDQFLSIRIVSGQRVIADGATLGRFRISLSYVDDLPQDPRVIAVNLLDRVYSRRPDRPLLATAMAQSLAAQTPPKLQEAMRYATAAVSLSPDNPLTHSLLIRLILANNPRSADRLFEVALSSARRILELDPSSDALKRLANAQLVLGDELFLMNPSESVLAYRTALELAPENFQRYANIGYSTGMQGNHAEALKWFEKGAVGNPQNDPWLYSHYGHSLHKLGRHQDAIEQFKKSLKISPNSPITLSRLAICHATLEEYEQAIQVWNKSFEISPDAMVQSNIGVTQCKRKDYAAAVSAFESALNVSATNQIALQGLLFAFAHSKPAAELADLLKTHPKLSKTDIEIQQTAVTALSETGEMGEANPAIALRLAEALLDAHPDNPIAWQGVALTRLLTSDFEGAVQAADSAHDGSKMGDPAALHIKAIALQKLNRTDDAQKSFDLANQLTKKTTYSSEDADARIRLQGLEALARKTIGAARAAPGSELETPNQDSLNEK